MFMKIFTRICVVFVATELLVGFVVLSDTKATIASIEAELAPVITIEAAPTVEPNPDSDSLEAPMSSDDLVQILIEESLNTVNDPFESFNQWELECIFTEMLNEFTMEELVAVSNNTSEDLSRMARMEETWERVCGIDPSLIGAVNA